MSMHVSVGEICSGDTLNDDFVLAALATLRAERYRPAGWGHFLARSWRRARCTAKTHPRLVVSWARTMATLALTETGALAIAARLDARPGAWTALPGAWGSLALAGFDVYAHLGMNAREPGGPLFSTLGWPTGLTLARRATSAYLWGHLLAMRPTSLRGTFTVLALGSATDIADGALARHMSRQTRLGAYLDAVADYEWWAALALTLGMRRRLPGWCVALLLARFSVPFCVAMVSYFAWGRRIAVASTGTGKLAGAALALACLAALAPTSAWPAARLRRMLYGTLAVLLVTAPAAQLRRVWRLARVE